MLQQILEGSEWPVRRNRLFLLPPHGLIVRFLLQIPGVLLVMTLETQQFPIAAVKWIVVVVVILVMDGKLAKSFARKFAAAPTTDVGKNIQGSVPISRQALPSIPSSLGNDLVQLADFRFWPLREHVSNLRSFGLH